MRRLSGVLLGIVGALGLTRFISNLLYGAQPIDPLTFVGVSVVLVVVVVLACYSPARRASKVDPMQVLRYEHAGRACAGYLKDPRLKARDSGSTEVD